MDKCECCELITVGRDYENGGFSCGNCGTVKGSDAWDKIVELRAANHELRVRLAGHNDIAALLPTDAELED